MTPAELAVAVEEGRVDPAVAAVYRVVAGLADALGVDLTGEPDVTATGDPLGDGPTPAPAPPPFWQG